MMTSGMCFAFNFMQVHSDFDEKIVMRNMSLMSIDPNFAFLVDNVLSISSLARGCSAAGEVTGPS